MHEHFIRAVRAPHIERVLQFVYALVILFSILDIVWPPVWAYRPGPYTVLAISVASITALGATLGIAVVRGGWWRIERLALYTMLLGFSLQVPLAVLLAAANQLWISAVAGSIGLCVFRLAVIWKHDFAPRVLGGET